MLTAKRLWQQISSLTGEADAVSRTTGGQRTNHGAGASMTLPNLRTGDGEPGDSMAAGTERPSDWRDQVLGRARQDRPAGPRDEDSAGDGCESRMRKRSRAGPKIALVKGSLRRPFYGPLPRPWATASSGGFGQRMGGHAPLAGGRDIRASSGVGVLSVPTNDVNNANLDNPPSSFFYQLYHRPPSTLVLLRLAPPLFLCPSL
ncbi:hypothetical protein CC78DRAFT_582598 [Lojkania enalia]|uniref:Uncharacterized protein n=1 Tax=Lojkania enalia TaxID=147567 RepID=A0A9P4K3X4_9PLEO|nr:hypothetical protein CC78DRAFT_582598 [Didymosphaeria enalia]